MTISIKNDRAEKLPRQMAKETLIEIGRRCRALPDLDTRSADEILGYDENGTFR